MKATQFRELNSIRKVLLNKVDCVKLDHSRCRNWLYLMEGGLNVNGIKYLWLLFVVACITL